MKETDFINQNKKKWHEFEKLSKETEKDPDKLSELFIEMTEDLSYARTFYPKRSVRVYLNFLSQKIYNSFYKQKTKMFSSFFGFWKTGLPTEMYRSRKQLLTAFIIFMVSIFIGAISSHIDPDFLRVILGDHYVEMTEEFINDGDPMAVYKQEGETSMFLSITINNMRVAFFAFIFGVFFSIGTSFLLIYNGIMLGAFQYFFYIKNLLLTSFLVIWIHGTLEISAIVIAGCAGIVLGNGLLFPKTLTRTQSLQINAKRGMKILLGTMPLFLIAGFLEGFVTRHTEMHDLFKWAIILSSLAFIISYYVIYPIRVAKKIKFDKNITEKPIYIETVKLEKYKIRTVGNIFYDTFQFYRQYFNHFGKIIFLIILPLIFIYSLILYNNSQIADYFLTEGENTALSLSANSHYWTLGFVINALLFSLNIATIHHAMSKIGEEKRTNYLKTWRKEIWSYFFKTIPFVAILYFLLLMTEIWFLLVILGIPFIILAIFPSSVEKGMFFKGIGKGINYGAKNWGSTIVIILMMSVLGWIFSWAYHNPILPGFDLKAFIFDKLVEWHTITVFDNFMVIKNVVSSILALLIIHLIVPFIFIACGFQFFSIKEKEEAISLRKRLEGFGKTNKIYESKK